MYLQNINNDLHFWFSRLPAAGAAKCGKCPGADAYAGFIQRLRTFEDQAAQHSAGHEALQVGHVAFGHALHQAANYGRGDRQPLAEPSAQPQPAPQPQPQSLEHHQFRRPGHKSHGRFVRWRQLSFPQQRTRHGKCHAIAIPLPEYKWCHCHHLTMHCTRGSGERERINEPATSGGSRQLMTGVAGDAQWYAQDQCLFMDFSLIEK